MCHRSRPSAPDAAAHPSNKGAPGGIWVSGQVRGTVQQESLYLVSTQYLSNRSTLAPDRRTQTSTIFAAGSKTRPQMAASSSPGLSGRPRRLASPLSIRNPASSKPPVLADAGAQGRFSPFESGRRGSGYGTTECSFRRGSFDRLSDLDWRTQRRECARSSWPLSSLSVMPGQGATHRAAAPSCTPATRDRAGRLHRDVPGRPAVCRNPGLLDDPALASVSRPGSPGVRRHPADSRPSRSPLLEPRRHPGVPAGASARSCAVTLDQPHRRGRRSPCGRRGTAIQEDLVGGKRGRSCGCSHLVDLPAGTV